jgi:hypothetical protein
VTFARHSVFAFALGYAVTRRSVARTAHRDNPYVKFRESPIHIMLTSSCRLRHTTQKCIWSVCLFGGRPVGGRTDIGFWHGATGNISFGLSDGALINWTPAGNAWPSIPSSSYAYRFVSDLTGDGRDDLNFWYLHSGDFWVGESDGSSVQFSVFGNPL